MKSQEPDNSSDHQNKEGSYLSSDRKQNALAIVTDSEVAAFSEKQSVLNEDASLLKFKNTSFANNRYQQNEANSDPMISYIDESI